LNVQLLAATEVIERCCLVFRQAPRDQSRASSPAIHSPAGQNGRPERATHDVRILPSAAVPAVSKYLLLKVHRLCAVATPGRLRLTGTGCALWHGRQGAPLARFRTIQILVQGLRCAPLRAARRRRRRYRCGPSPDTGRRISTRCLSLRATRMVAIGQHRRCEPRRVRWIVYRAHRCLRSWRHALA
jgi:hypothetical protein